MGNLINHFLSRPAAPQSHRNQEDSITPSTPTMLPLQAVRTPALPIPIACQTMPDEPFTGYHLTPTPLNHHHTVDRFTWDTEGIVDRQLGIRSTQ